MNTELLTAQQIARGAEIIRNGGLLALPTETVYGLGADALNPVAVQRIFEAKGRPQNNPLILHIPDATWLERYCHPIPPIACLLAEAFWPGPLTMILHARELVPRVTTGGLDTAGMRCPQHPTTRAIIATAGVPIAAPSANTSGRPSCTDAASVLEDMGGKIDAILDGGPCTVGVESTILDLTCDPPCLLRPGGLPVEEIEALLGVKIPIDPAVLSQLPSGQRPRAPGMAYRHYAPRAPLTVVEGDPEKTARYLLTQADENTGILCFEEYLPLFPHCHTRSLGSAADLPAQARSLFHALRYFDSTPATRLFAQCPPPTGLGLAIGNRIKKAAGFHIITIPQEDSP